MSGGNGFAAGTIVLIGVCLVAVVVDTVAERRESAPTTLEVLRTETYQGPSFSVYGGTHWVAITPTGAIELDLDDYARLSKGGLHCVTSRKSNIGPLVARILHPGACRSGDR